MKINYTELKKYFIKALISNKCPKAVADDVCDALINASLMGIDSHGINLFETYINNIRNKRIKSKNKIKFNKKKTFLLVDGNNNFSHFVAQRTLEKAYKIAKKSGICLASVSNVDHYAAAGIHGYNFLEKRKLNNLSIMSFTNADSLATSTYAKKRFFGTNPISYVLRRSKDKYIYIDMSTTQITFNKVKNIKKANSYLNNNLARDKFGKITKYPSKVFSLEPIGGYKGFVLGLLVELMTSGITGSNVSNQILPMYGEDQKSFRKISQCFILFNFDILKTNGFNNIYKQMEKNLPKKYFKLIPGNKEKDILTYRKKNGIPIDNEYLKIIKNL